MERSRGRLAKGGTERYLKAALRHERRDECRRTRQQRWRPRVASEIGADMKAAATPRRSRARESRGAYCAVFRVALAAVRLFNLGRRRASAILKTQQLGGD